MALKKKNLSCTWLTLPLYTLLKFGQNLENKFINSVLPETPNNKMYYNTV
jgi:hypothetical protein